MRSVVGPVFFSTSKTKAVQDAKGMSPGVWAFLRQGPVDGASELEYGAVMPCRPTRYMFSATILFALFRAFM